MLEMTRRFFASRRIKHLRRRIEFKGSPNQSVAPDDPRSRSRAGDGNRVATLRARFAETRTRRVIKCVSVPRGMRYAS